MTEAIGTAMNTAALTAKGASTFMVATQDMPLGLYKFENVLIGGSGNSLTWDVGSAHFVTSNTDDSNKPVAGKNYDLEGVVFNSKTSSNVEYVTVVVTKAEEHVEAGAVSIEGPAAVNVGESIELTASVVGGGNVSWTLKEEGASAFATLTPANDNKVSVTGVAAGNVTVVATCGDKSAEHAVTVSDPSQAVQTASIVFADVQGITNGTEYETDPFVGTGFNVAFGHTGSTSCKYYTTGTAMRVYGGGYFQVNKTGTANIAKIELTFDGSNKPAADSDITVDGGSYDVATGTWTGNAESVKMTRNGTSGHWRIQSITVTFVA